MRPDEMYAKLLKLVAHKTEEKPEAGFKTISEWSLHFKISNFSANKLIKRLKKIGKISQKEYNRKWQKGIRPVMHYKITA